jgi:hypothetical protein
MSNIITKEDERFSIVRKLHEEVAKFWGEKGALFSAWWELASLCALYPQNLYHLI